MTTPQPPTTPAPAMPDGIFNDIRNQAPPNPGSINREAWLMREAILWAWAQRDEEVQQAEQRGADAELEASLNWLIENHNPRWAHALRAARRPPAPTLRERALEVLRWQDESGRVELHADAVALIREALLEATDG